MIPIMNGSLSSSSSSSRRRQRPLMVQQLPLLLIIMLTIIINSNSNNNGCCHGFSTTISAITSQSPSSSPFTMALSSTTTMTKNLSFLNNPRRRRRRRRTQRRSSIFSASHEEIDGDDNKPPPPYLIFADDDDDTCYINRDTIDISSLKRRYRTNEIHCIDEDESSAIIIYSANLINFDKSKTNNNNKMIFWTIGKDNITNDDDENKIESDNENNDGKDNPFSVIYSAYNDEQMKFIELFNPSDVVTTELRIITSRIVRSVSRIRNLSLGLGWLIYDDSNKEEEQQREGRKNEEIIMKRKKRLSMLSMGLLSGGGWMWLWKANHLPSSLLGYQNIITQFLNDCLYGATTGILSNNYMYFQILGKSIVLLLFLRFIMIDLLLKKLIGRRINNSNNNNNDNNDYLLKPIGINNPIVQNLSTISIMVSNVMLLSNSVLQFLFLAYIKLPIFITLKLVSSILLRISNNNNNNMSVSSSSDKDKQSIRLKKKQQEDETLLKNLSSKIRMVANQVLLWKASPSSKSSLISLARSDNDNNDNSNNLNRSFIRINAAFLGPIKEEIIFRYAFDKIWHGVGGLFSMLNTRSALILGSGNTMRETASAAIAGGGSLSANTPAWIWMNSLLFGLIHMGNWFPVRKDNVASTSKFNAWDNIYGALFQCTISFIGARFLFNPLYTKRGIAASIGAHIALNTFVMAFSFGGSKPTDDKENSNEER